MPVDVLQTSLMRFLHDNNASYYGKAQDLRSAIAGWLSFIPATFPHYTNHTIEHSEEIISQMSKLLFVNGNYQRPVLEEMSSTEAYILVAAAYLHDAGMTVSDNEKRRILQSAEWRDWVENGSGTTRFREIAAFREDRSGHLDITTRNFLADVQLRYLIAEHVRRTHHIRGGDILAMYQNEMAQFAYNDPILTQTIASVCVAHGLQQNELTDSERFPERRDVRDEQVNVRLLAVLLRLGDLLDMTHNRACPLLLNAASPIPADSMAHWTQYQRIGHRLVAHDKIEITASCENEEEHRFLHDWCAWLVTELDQARRLMVRSARHAEWVPPIASIDQVNTTNTIIIKPAKGARYIPARWRFELDTKAVFDRLIYDALDNPWDFLRELMQNAADATRCSMFADLLEQEGSTPPYPTQVDKRVRDRYPIRVTLSTTQIHNELSGETEERQVLAIEDEGIGMDKEVVQRYLLQVGRSFYTTREFRDSFGFVASSRFGIGFLSVFGVSDDVTVDTYKPTGVSDPEPLKLRLTGPRSYLLTEKGNRHRSGTSIQVVLRKTVEKGYMTSLIKQWCERLEFPISINDLGNKTEITAEEEANFLKEYSLPYEKNARAVVRAFPVNREGIEGSLFVVAHVDAQGRERWNKARWMDGRARENPLAIDIRPPLPAVLFHGINTNPITVRDISSHYDDGIKTFSRRIDLRGERFNPALTRSDLRFGIREKELPEIQSRWDEILREHLDANKGLGEELWQYKQDLCEHIGSINFWLEEEVTFLVIDNGKQRYASLKEFDSLEAFSVIYPQDNPEYPQHPKDFPAKDIPEINGILLLENLFFYLSERYLDYIFDKRDLVSVDIIGSNILCTWGLRNEALKRRSFDVLLEADLPPEFISIKANKLKNRYISAPIILNKSHPFGEWCAAVKIACEKGICGLSKENYEKLESVFLRSVGPYEDEDDNFETFNNFLLQWKDIPNLPDNLVPPLTEIEESQIIRPHFY